MRIACPGCAAEYEVPSANLSPHRKVRCTRCSAEWIPVQEAPIIEPDPPHPMADATADASADPMAVQMADAMADPGIEGNAARPRQTAMDRLAAAPPPRRPRTLRAAWILTVLVLVGTAAAAMTWRGQVTRVWPASALILGNAGRGMAAAAKDPNAVVKSAKSAD